MGGSGFGTFALATRLDISLKKNTTTLKCDLDLPVAVLQAMVFAKKIFSNRKSFFSNLQTAVIFFQKKTPIFRNWSLPVGKYFLNFKVV